MDVASFMTPDPIAVRSDETVDVAMRLMDDCAIRHLPIVDDGRLVGVVSDRDLLDATGWRVLGPRGGDSPGNTELRKWMQSEVVTVGPEEPAVAAAIEVVLRGIGCLPVLERGKLVGIVTEMDLLDLFARLCRDGQLDSEANPAIEAVACREAVSISPEATVAQADVLCHAKGFRHLPVLRDGELVGILSDRDLRRTAGADVSGDATIDSLMTRNVVTVGAEEPLSSAARMMVEHRVSSLPVVAEGGVGIVTAVDILDHATDALRSLKQNLTSP